MFFAGPLIVVFFIWSLFDSLNYFTFLIITLPFYWSSFLEKSSDYVIRGYTPDLYIWKKFLFYASGVSPPLTDSIFFGSKTSESVNRGVPLLTDTTLYIMYILHTLYTMMYIMYEYSRRRHNSVYIMQKACNLHYFNRKFNNLIQSIVIK